MTAPKLARNIQYGRWNEKARVYEVPNLGALPSVTSIIGMMDKPALVSWAGNQAAEYAIDNRDALNQLDPEAAKDAIKGAWRRNRDRAANFGTAVHEAIESGTMPPDDDERAGYVRGSIRALNDLGIDVDAQELTLVSVQHGYAGTADVVGHSLNGSVILDWKSGKGLYDSAALQLAALMQCDHYYDEETGKLVAVEPFDVGYAVRLTPTRWYHEEIRRDSGLGENTFEAFLGLIPVWHYKTQAEVWNG